MHRFVALSLVTALLVETLLGGVLPITPPAATAAERAGPNLEPGAGGAPAAPGPQIELLGAAPQTAATPAATPAPDGPLPPTWSRPGNLAGPRADVKGEKRAIVLRVYFSDYANTSRYTTAQVQGFMGQLDTLYRNTSYTAMSLNSQVTDLYKVPSKRDDYVDKSTSNTSTTEQYYKLINDAITASPKTLNWDNIDAVLVLFAETTAGRFHRGQGTGGCSLPMGPGGKTKSVGCAIFGENPDDVDNAVWGRMAHEIGHAFQQSGPAHPSNYNNNFELMDANYPGTIGAFEKEADQGYPGWLPPSKYQLFVGARGILPGDPGYKGGVASLYALEYNPTSKPNIQAVKAHISKDLYYLITVRRRTLGDDLNPGYSPQGIPDEGVLIERVQRGGNPKINDCADPAKPDQKCPRWVEVKGKGGNPDVLWKQGDNYQDTPDGIGIFIDRKVDDDNYIVKIAFDCPPPPTATPRPPPTATWTPADPIVRQAPRVTGTPGPAPDPRGIAPCQSEQPDVFLYPWTSPPGNTYESTDIWVDSPVNGYGTYSFGKWKSLDGDEVPRLNGDRPVFDQVNRLYARVRNGGGRIATDIVVHFDLTDPPGRGIAGSNGWKEIGVVSKAQFPQLASLDPGAFTDVYVDWTPKFSNPDPNQLLQAALKGEVFFHTCVRVRIDPVVGETVLGNQDGDFEQENIDNFEYKIGGGPAGQVQLPVYNSKITLRNDDPAHGKTFSLSYRADVPADWQVSVNNGQNTVALNAGEVRDIPIIISPPPRSAPRLGGPAALPQADPAPGTIFKVDVAASYQVNLVNPTKPNRPHIEFKPLGGVSVQIPVRHQTYLQIGRMHDQGGGTIEIAGRLVAPSCTAPDGSPLYVYLQAYDASRKPVPGANGDIIVYNDCTFNTATLVPPTAKSILIIFAGTNDLASAGSGLVVFDPPNVTGRVVPGPCTPTGPVTITVAETGATATAGSDGRFTFSNLPDGTLTFVVTAAGCSPTSVPVVITNGQTTAPLPPIQIGGPSTTPTAGSLRFISPVRVLDTRPNDTAAQIFSIGYKPDGSAITPAPLAAGSTTRFLVSGKTFAATAIPTDTTGILANVTIVPVSPGPQPNPQAAPAGAAGGNRALVNPSPGRSYVTLFAGDVASTPNALTVPLNPGIPISFNFAASSLSGGASPGTFSLFTTDAVDAVVDIAGYASPTTPATGGNLKFISPVRVVDTRPNDAAAQITTIGFNPDGTPISPTPLQPDVVRRFGIAGRTFGATTVPTDTTAVLAHITNVQDQSSGGFVTLFPGDATRPNASTLNPVTPIAFNSPLVALGAAGSGANAGTLAVFSKTQTHIAIDIVGYFSPSNPAAGALSFVRPTRIVDTRAGSTTGFNADGSAVSATPLQPQTTRRFAVGGKSFGELSIPSDVKAVLANVTIVGPVAGGFVTLLPGDAPEGRPNVSTVNPVTPGAASFWAVPVPTAGTVAVYMQGDTPHDLVLDLLGYIR